MKNLKLIVYVAAAGFAVMTSTGFIVASKNAKTLPTCSGTPLGAFQFFTEADSNCPTGWHEYVQTGATYDNGIYYHPDADDMGCYSKAVSIPRDPSTCTP